MLEAERVLVERGIQYKLIELSSRALTVEDVIKFSKGDIEIGEICKTIILKDGKGGLHAFFLKGSDRLNFRKVRAIIGSKASIATASEVSKATGVEPGAVCPLLLNVPLIIDIGVMDLKKVNFGSGNHLYGVEMRTPDFFKAVNYKMADVVDPQRK